MNEKLLQDAEINHQRLLDSYKLALDTWNNVEEHNLRRLPEPNLTSSEPLSHSLGLIEKFAEEFALAMDDDFNTREAVTKTMSVAREVTRLLNSELDEGDKQSVGFFAVELFEQQAGNVLGLLPTREQISVMNQESLEVKNRKDQISEKVEELLHQRSQARAEKNWSEADRIRDELNEMGVTVKDTPEGPIWDLI